MEKKFYNFLAEDYDLKRRNPWNALSQYIEQIKKKGFQISGINLDLGCANGRNIPLFLNSNTTKLIGIDKTLNFLKLAKTRIYNEETLISKEKRQISLILGDISHLPLRGNIVNNIFLIATLHHIETYDSRVQVLEDTKRILKENGRILTTLWRKYQKKYRLYFLKDKFKRLFNRKYHLKQKNSGLTEFGDKYVPWTISKENKTYNRFYHFFSKKETMKLFSGYNILEFNALGGPDKKDNFFILAQKKVNAYS